MKSLTVKEKQLPFKGFELVRFFCFLSLLWSPRLHLFDQKYSKNSKYFLQEENWIYFNVIYPCHDITEFLASLLQCQNPSEIILIC